MSLDEARVLFRAKTDEMFVPTAAESSTWHSIPLAFAVLPAIAGAFIDKGEGFTTDALLLLLAGIFLHWLVKFPWEWYQKSAVLGHERDVSDILRDTRDPAADQASNTRSSYEERQRKRAKDELKVNENRALLACFIGPIVGGWLLHLIRSSLSRPSGGLVSNFNLSIFVLAAELRPFAQVVKLIRGRNEFLQGIVTHPPVSKMEILAAKVEELHAEVRELSALATRAIEREADVDALNRAVRRYEKKEAMHSALTENRIHEIDIKLNDVVSLATAATARQNQQAITMIVFQWCAAVLVLPFALAWKVISLPAKAVESLTALKSPLLLKHQAQRKSPRDKPKGRTAMKGRTQAYLE
jgi:signal transduction histidine kinase